DLRLYGADRAGFLDHSNRVAHERIISVAVAHRCPQDRATRIVGVRPGVPQGDGALAFPDVAANRLAGDFRLAHDAEQVIAQLERDACRHAGFASRVDVSALATGGCRAER